MRSEKVLPSPTTLRTESVPPIASASPAGNGEAQPRTFLRRIERATQLDEGREDRLERDYGPVLAAEVAREMVVYLRGDGHHPQESIYLDYLTHLHPGVHQLQHYLACEPESAETLGELARRFGMSERNLSRAFRTATGVSVHEYRTRQRLEHAKALMPNTSLTMEAIATRCGFSDARQLRRLMNRHAASRMHRCTGGADGASTVRSRQRHDRVSTRTLARRCRRGVHECLLAVGLIPLILPPVDPAIAAASLGGLAGLVFTSGEDIGAQGFGQQPHPASGTPHRVRDAYEIALAREAYKRRIPTLALCRGAQIVNVAFGGTIIQDIPSGHPRGRGRVHEVNIDADSRLASILGGTTIVANSTHHQSIDQPGTGLEVVGRCPDGIIEAVEHSDRTWWMVAVQWHPETLTDTVEDWDRRLFTGFAEEIRARQRE